MNQTHKPNRTSLTIRSKLYLIGGLLLVSIIALELSAAHNESLVRQTMLESELRQGQLQILERIEVSLITTSLAAMDMIVDKDSGAVASELKVKIDAANENMTENLAQLQTIADTGEERRNAETILKVYPDYEKAVMNDLPNLIHNRAGEAEFSKIDDLIDGLSRQMTDPLKEIIQSVERENSEATRAMLNQMDHASMLRRIFAAAVLAGLGSILFFLGRSILGPILSAKSMVQDIAQGEGDLTKRLEAGGDEIGDLSNWFNVFVSKLHEIISKLQTNLSTLNDSAEGLSGLSQSLAEGSEDANGRSNAVAAAAEEMSSNMGAVAAASEQASVNVNMVATAAEEMNATVAEIAANTAKARQIVENAVGKTSNASKRVNQLGYAANEINKVNEVITEISEQTNLLALNATIEAARAGEAGKGFAVVANEIKELAKQTAEATLEIRDKISAIQGSTDLTVTEMAEINTIINDVNEIVTTIATAVEEQSASTQEISSNIAQAAQGISEVNENVSQSSNVSKQISEEVSGVSQVASTLQGSSNDVKKQSGELQNFAARLAEIISQFKL